MNFDKLHAMIPYAYGGKMKSLRVTPYPNISLALPGRHYDMTTPKGGDFVVMVTDPSLDWTEHQFTHADLFADIELKADADANATNILMMNYLNTVKGDIPDKYSGNWSDGVFDGHGIHPQTFLYAVQCLAVAEHRRYPQHEAKFGGRYLPFRAAAGIAEGLWSALEAQEKTRKMGRPGVEWLEKDYGTPVLTKELMNV